ASDARTGSLRKVPASSLPGNVQLNPPLVENETPDCRKLLLVVSNCRQPMAMRLGSSGSTQIEGSLAASPRTFCPVTLTLTWKLVTKGAEMMVLTEYWPEPGNGGSGTVSSSGGGGGLAKTSDSNLPTATMNTPHKNVVRWKKGNLRVRNFIMPSI